MTIVMLFSFVYCDAATVRIQNKKTEISNNLTGQVWGSLLGGKKKTIKVSPAEAKIYVDGNYVADGMYELDFGRDDFVVVKVECPGYVEKEMKIFKTDKRKTISVQLREDDAFAESEVNELANQSFTIQVREGIKEETAWKLLNQVLLDYFDEIKVADKVSGFINTAWAVRVFQKAEAKVRTRVMIKELTTGSGLTYQVKVMSEIGPLNGTEQGFKPYERILKKYQPLINEIQTRLR